MSKTYLMTGVFTFQSLSQVAKIYSPWV